MMQIGRWLRPAVGLLTVTLAAACAPAEPPAGVGAAAAVTVTPEMIQEGRTLFTGAGLCGVCHGPQARGGSLGPNLTNNQWIWVQPDGNVHAQVATLIRNGIEQPRQYPAPMPPMGGANLTEAQVNALAAYVVSLNM
jgi:mono/diheme cytochrome c family protein